ncbi:MAG: hypothetical protein IJD60_11440 [Clostridia bacterium]|nr:hypothetical protein [Clostridia bacterium]
MKKEKRHKMGARIPQKPVCAPVILMFFHPVRKKYRFGLEKMKTISM